MVEFQYQVRDEHSTGLGLDWIPTIASSLGFGLDQDRKSFQKFVIRTVCGLTYKNRVREFFVQKLSC